MSDTIRKQQLMSMLHLQDEMNQKINSRWRDEANPWYRAIWTECAEMLDHIGWKWWKAQSIDLEQVHLEIIDIWHFGLSDMLNRDVDYNIIAEKLTTVMAMLYEPETSKIATPSDLVEIVENFSLNTLKTKAFDSLCFAKLARAAGLSFESLFSQYIGKNVLNRFRQDHGYKTGDYEKIWNGKEDNVWLVDIVSNVSPTEPDYAGTIYSHLNSIYQKCVATRGVSK